ncbi:MAG TPA: S-layer homology domain-containing protein [Symbiobacteriaceae bacterium]|nr:S-layer homology domain-containing protein [Symbiobacteriaceae bacterium]
MSTRSKRFAALCVAAAVLLLLLPAPMRLWADTPLMKLTLPAPVLTGMVGAKVTLLGPVASGWRLAAELGKPGDYPTVQTITSVNRDSVAGETVVHFDTERFKDGVWTLSLQQKSGMSWITHDSVQVTMDNRPGVPLTEPGTATGTIKVVSVATGTVAIDVQVEDAAVEWELQKQPASQVGTNNWTKMHASALRQDSYHWYTRGEAAGQYTLRLEVFDTNRHSRYTEFIVTVDNRWGLPQTEPGTVTAPLTLPKIVSGALPIPLNFSGVARAWRLQYIDLGVPDPRLTAIASGQAGAASSVAWNTGLTADGTYLVVLEVEDQNRHIWQTTATTTVANKVTSTIQQTIEANEEHQFPISAMGGLTSFTLSANPTGYYQLSIRSLDGTQTLASERVNPLSKPVQLDLPGGKYLLNVRSLFTLPASKYLVTMRGATAYTIPLARITTNLPLTMRGVTALPALVAPGSPRPAEGAWYVDGGAPTTLLNPDGTVDVDTRPLAEGRHTITFEAVNPVGFKILSRFPFMVDNQGSFVDVDDAHAARWAVELLKDSKIVGGYEDGTFKPANTVTRAELAKMLSMAAGLDVSGPYSGAFGDVAVTDWFAPYVEAVYAAGLVKGYDTGAGLVYKPGAQVSRAEMMVMLLRAADIPEVLAANRTSTLQNVDWKEVQEWARPSIFIGMKMNLLTERYGRKLEPNSPAERGEIALALGRLLLNDQMAHK